MVGDFKIGTVFGFKGVRLEVVKENELACTRCHFADKPKECDIFKCRLENRPDKTNVVYIRTTKPLTKLYE